MNRNHAFGAAATALVLLAIALGIHAAGTPAQQRLVNADETRVRDLNALSMAISGHYRTGHQLPRTLAELNPAYPLHLKDPDSRPYQYRPHEGGRFELCAVFATDNRDESPGMVPRRLHAAGPQCFTYPE